MLKPDRAQKSRRVFFTSVACAIACILALFALGLRQVPQTTLWTGKPLFDAGRAFDWTRKLATEFPHRVPWRPEHAQAQVFLKNEFRKLGYEPKIIAFDEIINSQHISGLENIYGVLPGTELPDEYLVVLGHYDITDTTVEGATDDASGVGTVLELARAFKSSPQKPSRSIIFLLTDSEEFGAFWGARNFAEKFLQVSQIAAAISLDYVAPDHQKSILVLQDGLHSGYTPLWLRELALASIRRVPFEVEDMTNFLEFLERSLLIPAADHGALLRAGIPALNLFGKSDDFTYEMSVIHHTPEDNMRHVRVESFESYGKATETLLRSIDAQPERLATPEHRDSDYFKITQGFYLLSWSIGSIQFLFFMPFFTYIALLIGSLRRRRRTHLVRVVRNEIKAFSLILGSLIAGYALLRFLPALNIITKYEMYPATQKSPMLYEPKYLAFGLVFSVIAALYFILKRFFSHRTDSYFYDRLDIQIRHSFLGLILSVIALAGLLKNAYLTDLMLMPPCYLWMFMSNDRRSRNSRFLNALLLLGGLVSLIAVCIAMSTIFHVGVFYWYFFLAISYGLFSMYAVIVALAVITVGIRILRNHVL